MTKKTRIEDKAILHSFYTRHCIVCGVRGCDPAHIKTKGSGGDDIENNLMPLCRKHHSEQHATGIVSFINKYPSVKLYIEMKGWRLAETKLTKVY
jgi:hypothetical protein